MPLPPLPFPEAPVLSYKAMLQGLSHSRIGGYSRQEDRDSVDAVARYFWNMALACAAWPALHVLEVSVRNALYGVGVRQTAGRALKFGTVQCWLDAGLLEKREQEDVQKAVQRLAPARRTPGHLVGELSLGFWVRLCNRPYEQGRSSGPALWPEAINCFHGCPRPKRNREGIRAALNDLADFRNRIAHHHPIWDRRPDRRMGEINETIGWLNPELASAVRQTSNVQALFDAGHSPFRPIAEGTTSLWVHAKSR